MNVPHPKATVSLSDAVHRCWDVVVIGAGPAGALAAHQAASAGQCTLLIDKSSFPRWKVCGCCLNGAGQQALRAVELHGLPDELNARPLHRWQVLTAKSTFGCPLPGGLALSREALDAALIQQAVEAGADFLPETEAMLGGCEPGGRTVQIGPQKHRESIGARMVVGATGLSGRAWRGYLDLVSEPRPGARVGAGVVLDGDVDFYESGTIYMACGRAGYVGVVRLEDGRLDVAAALDLDATRAAGGPGKVIETTLRDARAPLPGDMDGCSWRGTAALTRRPRQPYGERLLLIGDAAGYVEPFTGEGIAWALWSAVAVTPLVIRGVQDWTPAIGQRWSSLHRRVIARRQIICRAVSRLLRSPTAMDVTRFVLTWAPWLAHPVIRSLNAPPRRWT